MRVDSYRTSLWVLVIGLMVTTTSCVFNEKQQITFEAYELENGLKVILHEDHRLPLVTTNIWYYVGAKDEEEGLSGFAHLFEHLMFRGTKDVPHGTFDRLIEGSGGSNNATTSPDRTNYFEIGPSNLLESFLFLEADRMANVGADMNQEKLDAEREVVRNERRQRSEMTPYGDAFTKIWPNMYPKGHPYHHPVIGSHEDLERATVDDVKAFFNKFYLPNNACLVVAGDFDPGQAKGWIQKYFGHLKPGPLPNRIPIPELQTLGDKIVTLEDKVNLAQTQIIYHSPKFYTEGDADLDIASFLLSNGKSSHLYKSLVYEKKIAQSVSATQWSSYLGSIYVIQARAVPGVSLETLEAEIDKVVQDFKSKIPDQESIERARNQIEVMFWHELESLSGRADLLNRYQFHLGNPNGIVEDRERYMQVTPMSVKEYVNKYLTQDNRLIIRVLPKAKTPPPIPSS